MDASDGGVWREGVTFKGAASIDTRIRIIEASVENTLEDLLKYPRFPLVSPGQGT